MNIVEWMKRLFSTRYNDREVKPLREDHRRELKEAASAIDTHTRALQGDDVALKIFMATGGGKHER